MKCHNILVITAVTNKWASPIILVSCVPVGSAAQSVMLYVVHNDVFR